MGYCQYLRNTLKPLGIYDLDNGLGYNELYAEGTELDKIYTALCNTEREMNINSSVADGIDKFSALVPFAPVSPDTASLKSAIKALLFGTDAVPSVKNINNVLSGCGIAARVEEYGTNTVRVSFPDTEGAPQSFSEIKNRIEQLIPCHLAIVYECEEED